MTHRSNARRLLAIGTIVVAASSGCTTRSRESTVLTKHTALKLSTAELRLQIRSLVKPFSGTIEGAADGILRHATTSQERVLGLRVKIDGIPAVQGALFEPDPVAAAFETAALLVQTQIFFEEGPGAELPELVRTNVVGAIGVMRGRLHELSDRIGATPEGQERFWSTVESWAHRHPMETFTTRETTHALFAEFMARQPAGIFATAGRVEETVADLAWRFDVYGEYIAKQARWHAELLVEESIARGLPRRTLESMGPIEVGLTELPFDLDTQRDIVMAAIRSERGLILDWVRDERLETLDFARLERQAVTGMVGDERQLVLDALRSEREALVEVIRQERAASMQDLADIVSDAMADSRSELIDHVALRAAQVVGGALVAAFLGCVGLMVVWRWLGRRRA